MDKLIKKYQWLCDCGKQGRPLTFDKACAASDRHTQAHERKLEWRFQTRLDSLGVK